MTAYKRQCEYRNSFHCMYITLKDTRQENYPVNYFFWGLIRLEIKRFIHP